MKITLIQPLYPYSANNSLSYVNFVIDELNNIEDSDLIVLPEVNNVPCSCDNETRNKHIKRFTEPLLKAVKETAIRCNAVVAVNILKPEDNTRSVNTTLLFDKKGNIAGEYKKQHLTPSEINRMEYMHLTDYRLNSNEPYITEIDGIRYGFLTCYDFYFYENYSQFARKNIDIIIGCSHQRNERHDVLETIGKFCSFACNSYVVRSSTSMGEDKDFGGCSMIVSPEGKILMNCKSKIGSFTYEIDNPKYKYMRSNCYGGDLILNNNYIEQGRTPWAYRPCGSFIKPSEENTPYPRVCAHRGFNTIAPENSLPAFGAAVALQAQEIEFDIWPSKDMELVVCHDDNLKRIATDIQNSKKICDMTYEEIIKEDVGAKYGKAFKGLKIARFEDVLKTFARHVIINLHIKSIKHDNIILNKKVFKKIIDLIYKYDCAEHVYIMTGEDDIMQTALDLAPEITRCMGAGNMPWQQVERAIKYKCKKIQLFKPYFNQEMINKAHENDIKCNVFWSDDAEETVKFLDMGIDTILTNDYLNISLAVKHYLIEKEKKTGNV